MTRFFTYVQRWLRPTYFQQVSLALDVGSLTTRIMVKDKTSMVQPTAIAIRQASGEILALGQRAADLQGKTPRTISVVFPLRQTHIQNVERLKEFLRAVIDNVGRISKLSPFTQFRVAMSVPHHARSTHRQVLTDMMHEMKLVRSVEFLSPLQAAFQSLQAQNIVTHTACVIVVGEGSTEIGVFHQGEIVSQVAVPVSEEQIVMKVIQTVRQVYQTEIGFDTALKVKQDISTLAEQPLRAVVRGKHVLSNLPTTVQINSGDFTPFLQLKAGAIAQAAVQVFSQLAPELVSMLTEQGVIVTGVGSAITGLDEYLSQQLHCAVKRSPHPQEDVVKGLWLHLRKRS